MNPHPSGRRAPLVLAALLAVGVPSAWADLPAQREEDDFRLRVGTAWVGGAAGGIYPLRCEVTNRGPERTLLFQYSGDDLPTVKRSLTVEQNATVRFTLSIPLVSTATFGRLEVFHRGRELERLEVAAPLPETDPERLTRASLLILAPQEVDRRAFEDAMNSDEQVRVSRFSHYYGGAGTFSVTEDSATITPSLLPESWIDYSGVDLIAVPLSVLERLSGDVREALLQWAECGGTLIVTQVGPAGTESADVARLLQLKRYAPSAWTQADRNDRPASLTWGNVGNNTLIRSEFGGPVDGVPGAWPGDAPFAYRPLLLGRLYLFPDDPFPGNSYDWAWFLRTLQSTRWQWAARHGVVGRMAASDFMNFLIPGVGQVPVMAFLVLITLFAIIIGPVNYILAARKRRQYLLVVTIPAISFVTSCSLFAYALIADGFSVRSRIVSYTRIDTNANRAVSYSRSALYAGLAPSAGLTFSSSTCVVPLQERVDGNRTVDWTGNTQHLASGWFRSRVMTQFAAVTHRDERGRLEVSFKDAESPPEAGNGFAFDIEYLVLLDSRNRWFAGENIAAGSAAALQPADLIAISRRFAQYLEEQPLTPPPGYTPPGSSWSFDYRARYDFDSGMVAQFQNGMLGRHLFRLNANELSHHGRFPPGSFLAVARTNPGVELGLKLNERSGSLHVIEGNFVE